MSRDENNYWLLWKSVVKYVQGVPMNPIF